MDNEMKFIDDLIKYFTEDFENKMKKKNIPAPLYEYGDWVKFKMRMGDEYESPKLFTGQVAIIDRYGTFEQNDEPSYDIYVEDMNCLFKHIRQSSVTLVKKGDGTCALDTPMNKSGEKQNAEYDKDL